MWDGLSWWHEVQEDRSSKGRVFFRVSAFKERYMDRKFDKEEATALAAYEPVDSEFRAHAHMVWRTEGKGINLYGLRWRYVRLALEE